MRSNCLGFHEAPEACEHSIEHKPPIPCSERAGLLSYSEAQLADDYQREQLVRALHGHHQKTSGARQLLYVPYPSPSGAAPQTYSSGMPALSEPPSEAESPRSATFCLLQPQAGAGRHGCRKVALLLRGLTVNRFSTFRSSNYGSLHFTVSPEVQSFLQRVGQKFHVTPPQDPREIKVRCELDARGSPAWTTYEIFLCHPSAEANSARGAFRSGDPNANNYVSLLPGTVLSSQPTPTQTAPLSPPLFPVPSTSARDKPFLQEPSCSDPQGNSCDAIGYSAGRSAAARDENGASSSSCLEESDTEDDGDGSFLAAVRWPAVGARTHKKTKKDRHQCRPLPSVASSHSAVECRQPSQCSSAQASQQAQRFADGGPRPADPTSSADKIQRQLCSAEAFHVSSFSVGCLETDNSVASVQDTRSSPVCGPPASSVRTGPIEFQPGVLHQRAVQLGSYASSDEDIFFDLKKLCIPGQTQVEALVHLGNICPYQQSNFLIMFLRELRLLRTVESPPTAMDRGLSFFPVTQHVASFPHPASSASATRKVGGGTRQPTAFPVFPLSGLPSQDGYSGAPPRPVGLPPLAPEASVQQHEPDFDPSRPYSTDNAALSPLCSDTLDTTPSPAICSPPPVFPPPPSSPVLNHSLAPPGSSLLSQLHPTVPPSLSRKAVPADRRLPCQPQAPKNGSAQIESGGLMDEDDAGKSGPRVHAALGSSSDATHCGLDGPDPGDSRSDRAILQDSSHPCCHSVFSLSGLPDNGCSLPSWTVGAASNAIPSPGSAASRNSCTTSVAEASSRPRFAAADSLNSDNYQCGIGPFSLDNPPCHHNHHHHHHVTFLGSSNPFSDPQSTAEPSSNASCWFSSLREKDLSRSLSQASPPLPPDAANRPDACPSGDSRSITQYGSLQSPSLLRDANGRLVVSTASPTRASRPSAEVCHPFSSTAPPASSETPWWPSSVAARDQTASETLPTGTGPRWFDTLKVVQSRSSLFPRVDDPAHQGSAQPVPAMSNAVVVPEAGERLTYAANQPGDQAEVLLPPHLSSAAAASSSTVPRGHFDRPAHLPCRPCCPLRPNERWSPDHVADVSFCEDHRADPPFIASSRSKLFWSGESETQKRLFPALGHPHVASDSVDWFRPQAAPDDRTPCRPVGPPASRVVLPCDLTDALHPRNVKKQRLLKSVVAKEAAAASRLAALRLSARRTAAPCARPPTEPRSRNPSSRIPETKDLSSLLSETLPAPFGKPSRSEAGASPPAGGAAALPHDTDGLSSAMTGESSTLSADKTEEDDDDDKSQIISPTTQCVFSIGDFVEIGKLEGRKDILENQTAEIIAISESPKGSDDRGVEHFSVTVSLCRADGRRFQGQHNPIREDVPTRSLRLLEKAEVRAYERRRSREYCAAGLHSTTSRRPPATYYVTESGGVYPPETSHPVASLSGAAPSGPYGVSPIMYPPVPANRLLGDREGRASDIMFERTLAHKLALPCGSTLFVDPSEPASSLSAAAPGGPCLSTMLSSGRPEAGVGSLTAASRASGPVYFHQSLVATPFTLYPPRTAEGVLCFFWDLEATGLHINYDDITQIACVCRRFYFSQANNKAQHPASGASSSDDDEPHLKPDSPTSGPKRTDIAEDKQTGSGYWEPVPGFPEDVFNCYVYTDRVIPEPVVQLTGITNEFLDKHGVSFEQAISDWAAWIASARRQHQHCPVWFVAHNGNRYDLPLLFQQEVRKLGQPPGTFLNSVGVVGIVDTVVLSRRLPWGELGHARRSHKLQALYFDVFHEDMPNEHDALGDVTGLAALMDQEPFLFAWCNVSVGWNLSQYLLLSNPAPTVLLPLLQQQPHMPSLASSSPPTTAETQSSPDASGEQGDYSVVLPAEYLTTSLMWPPQRRTVTYGLQGPANALRRHNLILPEAGDSRQEMHSGNHHPSSLLPSSSSFLQVSQSAMSSCRLPTFSRSERLFPLAESGPPRAGEEVRGPSPNEFRCGATAVPTVSALPSWRYRQEGCLDDQPSGDEAAPPPLSQEQWSDGLPAPRRPLVAVPDDHSQQIFYSGVAKDTKQHEAGPSGHASSGWDHPSTAATASARAAALTNTERRPARAKGGEPSSIMANKTPTKKSATLASATATVGPPGSRLVDALLPPPPRVAPPLPSPSPADCGSTYLHIDDHHNANALSCYDDLPTRCTRPSTSAAPHFKLPPQQPYDHRPNALDTPPAVAVHDRVDSQPGCSSDGSFNVQDSRTTLSRTEQCCRDARDAASVTAGATMVHRSLVPSQPSHFDERVAPPTLPAPGGEGRGLNDLAPSMPHAFAHDSSSFRTTTNGGARAGNAGSHTGEANYHNFLDGLVVMDPAVPAHGYCFPTEAQPPSYAEITNSRVTPGGGRFVYSMGGNRIESPWSTGPTVRSGHSQNERHLQPATKAEFLDKLHASGTPWNDLTRSAVYSQNAGLSSSQFLHSKPSVQPDFPVARSSAGAPFSAEPASEWGRYVPPEHSDRLRQQGAADSWSFTEHHQHHGSGNIAGYAADNVAAAAPAAAPQLASSPAPSATYAPAPSFASNADIASRELCGLLRLAPADSTLPRPQRAGALAPQDDTISSALSDRRNLAANRRTDTPRPSLPAQTTTVVGVPSAKGHHAAASWNAPLAGPKYHAPSGNLAHQLYRSSPSHPTKGKGAATPAPPSVWGPPRPKAVSSHVRPPPLASNHAHVMTLHGTGTTNPADTSVSGTAATTGVHQGAVAPWTVPRPPGTTALGPSTHPDRGAASASTGGSGHKKPLTKQIIKRIQGAASSAGGPDARISVGTSASAPGPASSGVPKTSGIKNDTAETHAGRSAALAGRYAAGGVPKAPPPATTSQEMRGVYSDGGSNGHISDTLLLQGRDKDDGASFNQSPQPAARTVRFRDNRDFMECNISLTPGTGGPSHRPSAQCGGSRSLHLSAQPAQPSFSAFEKKKQMRRPWEPEGVATPIVATMFAGSNAPTSVDASLDSDTLQPDPNGGFSGAVSADKQSSTDATARAHHVSGTAASRSPVMKPPFTRVAPPSYGTRGAPPASSAQHSALPSSFSDGGRRLDHLNDTMTNSYHPWNAAGSHTAATASSSRAFGATAQAAGNGNTRLQGSSINARNAPPTAFSGGVAATGIREPHDSRHSLRGMSFTPTTTAAPSAAALSSSANEDHSVKAINPSLRRYAGASSTTGNAASGSGTSMKGVKILKRGGGGGTANEKSDGKAQLAAAIAGVAYDGRSISNQLNAVASEAYKQKAAAAVALTQTPPCAIPSQGTGNPPTFSGGPGGSIHSSKSHARLASSNAGPTGILPATTSSSLSSSSQDTASLQQAGAAATDWGSTSHGTWHTANSTSVTDQVTVTRPSGPAHDMVASSPGTSTTSNRWKSH